MRAQQTNHHNHESLPMRNARIREDISTDGCTCGEVGGGIVPTTLECILIRKEPRSQRRTRIGHRTRSSDVINAVVGRRWVERGSVRGGTGTARRRVAMRSIAGSCRGTGIAAVDDGGGSR